MVKEPEKKPRRCPQCKKVKANVRRRPDDYARERLERKLREQQMSPEAREAETQKQRADRLEKEVEASKAEKREATVKQHAQQIQARMVADLEGAAAKVGLPKDVDGFAALHEVTQEYLGLGLPWNPERIAEEAKAKVEASEAKFHQRVLKGLKGAELLKYMGPEAVAEVKAHLVAEYRKTRTPYGGTKPSLPPAPAPKADTYLTPAQADAEMRALRMKTGGR